MIYNSTDTKRGFVGVKAVYKVVICVPVFGVMLLDSNSLCLEAGSLLV